MVKTTANQKEYHIILWKSFASPLITSCMDTTRILQCPKRSLTSAFPKNQLTVIQLSWVQVPLKLTTKKRTVCMWLLVICKVIDQTYDTSNCACICDTGGNPPKVIPMLVCSYCSSSPHSSQPCAPDIAAHVPDPTNIAWSPESPGPRLPTGDDGDGISTSWANV